MESGDAVRQSLTANGSRRYVENDEYGQFYDRITDAYARRVAAGDIEALAGLLGRERRLREQIGHAVTGLRRWYSWDDIARAAGMRRQSAWERWRDDEPQA